MWTLILLMVVLPQEEGAVAKPDRSFVDRTPQEIEARRRNTEARRSIHESARLIQWVGAPAARRWIDGSTLTVAFKGGTKDLWSVVAKASDPWLEQANINLSFVDENGEYREWTPAQDKWTADIRVSFDENGYWSAVGNESIDRAIFKPGEASMSLAGFADALPRDWRSIVLHEFGHALGFEHEHQHPGSTCKNELRWQEEAGYMKTWYEGFLWQDQEGRSPGVMAHYMSPPNNWTDEEIQANLFDFPASRRYEVGPYDRDSIMKYSFPSFLFLDQNADCNTPSPWELSAGDKNAVVDMYGRRSASVQREKNHELLHIDPSNLPPDLQQELRELTEKLLAARDRKPSAPM